MKTFMSVGDFCATASDAGIGIYDSVRQDSTSQKTPAQHLHMVDEQTSVKNVQGHMRRLQLDADARRSHIVSSICQHTFSLTTPPLLIHVS